MFINNIVLPQNSDFQKKNKKKNVILWIVDSISPMKILIQAIISSKTIPIVFIFDEIKCIYINVLISKLYI